MRTLILAEGKLTPCCSKSHITYCFNLDKEVDRINISFSYEPKKLLDREKSKEIICAGIRSFSVISTEEALEKWEEYLPVQNLLTVSVDDPKGFRGCAHRHSPEQNLFITEEEASYGFIPGKLGIGMWKVTLNLHAILTEVCKYRLHIWEGTGEDENLDSM